MKCHCPNIKTMILEIHHQIMDMSNTFRNYLVFIEFEGILMRSQVLYPKLKREKEQAKKRNLVQPPPFSKNVQTNVGHTFLRLISKHFPKNATLHKIFNKNTIKVSYSCMENMASIIKAHSKQITRKDREKPK